MEQGMTLKLTVKQQARKDMLRKKRANKVKRKATKRLMVPGQMVGQLRLLGRVRAPKDASPATKTRWRCECSCGRIVVIPQMYFRRANPKVACGECGERSKRAEFNREYRIWLMVRMRTRDPAHVAQKHYASRGIDIIDEWYDLATGFELFFAEVGPSPSRSHSLDRIDNTRGYEPNNVRWATAIEQRANQGDMVSGYTEQQIIDAGFSREEFTTLISNGANPIELIKGPDDEQD